MGLFDLADPLLGSIDGASSVLIPATVRLVLWGVLAGWLTMVVYRRLSNQGRIQELKARQKAQQKIIADFDGEFGELLPIIRHTLGLGMRQLGLSLGPALLATIPVLFLLAWVSGQFGYRQPAPGTEVSVSVSGLQDNGPALSWSPSGAARATATGWVIQWPKASEQIRLQQGDLNLLTLPVSKPVPVKHKRAWWNWFFANPIGYLPQEADVDAVHVALPSQRFIPLGPDWMQGWMFTFFGSFLLASVAFKLLLKID